MNITRALNIFALGLSVLAIAAVGARNLKASAPVTLLNVSYDPTRELYAQLNPLFAAHHKKATDEQLEIKQQHGGSSRQARGVIQGEFAADVVTFGLISDVESLQKRGLLAAGWTERLPDHSQPYYSTIVFVVRRGNPRGIRDWPDLLQPGVEIITPDPRSSGNGKLSALAAWGDVLARGGSEADAKAYLKEFYQHTPFLEAGARATAQAFAVEKLGDVHISWENEALREVAASEGGLEIVYPPRSILAEPAVAWVDTNVAQQERSCLAFVPRVPVHRTGARSDRAERLSAIRSKGPRASRGALSGAEPVPDHLDRKGLGRCAAKVLRRKWPHRDCL